MPACTLCGQHFPIRLKLDGIVHTLSSRKYCLECSPFKKHNTKALHSKWHGEGPLACTKCGKAYTADRTKGHRGEKCGTCWVREKRRRLRFRMVEYKGGKCQSCGYSKCLEALEFHHPDPTQKDFSLSGTTANWELIVTELDKCIMLCANCHRETHARLDAEALQAGIPG